MAGSKPLDDMPTPKTPWRSLSLSALSLLLGAGCVENEFIERPFDDIAVVAGDFDRVESTLDRLSISYQLYEGYICCAAYDPGIEPENIALSFEGLFNDEDGSAELLNFDALFVNSGARGLGEVTYNGVEDDDFVAADADRVAIVKSFVESRGRTLVVSDWGYDLVEAAWPDAIEWFGDDATLDAAQVGEPGTFVAQVQDEALIEALEQEQVAIEYNYSYWAVMEGVGEGSEVILRGDVEARVSAEEGVTTVPNVPVLVHFKAGAGDVYVSSFHWSAQAAGFADGTLVQLISGLRPGSANLSDATDTADTGGAQ
ncbi:MAG: hypothetical protein H6741_14400 [Alphaproteobacteria bacterium]|nr:hypothetical protein [Alphaproteobacteria bacterium]MCB9793907.1 hypothetical protein [Alphaproteobacteria bacterium]